jgi:hypothetical protein
LTRDDPIPSGLSHERLHHAFADGGALQALAPARPAVRVSALGSDAVVDGCLAAGSDLAWNRLMAALPTSTTP